MTAQEPRRSTGPRSGWRRSGSIRPREAPRPKCPSSSPTGPTSIRLSPATFVELSSDQERQAIEALAELMVPSLTGSFREPDDEDVPFDITPATDDR